MKGKSPSPDDLGTGLPVEYLARWFSRHDYVTPEHVRQKRPCWKLPDTTTPDGKTVKGAAIAITPALLRELVWRDDLAAFAFAFLREQADYLDDDGRPAIRKGAPWRLFPKQEELARITQDLIVEAASETGKSRDLVARALRMAHGSPGSLTGIGVNSEATREDLTAMLEFQVTRPDSILGGGLDGKVYKGSYFQLTFKNGARIQLRLCGTRGAQFLALHADLLLADECARWPSIECFSEFWRAAKTGAQKVLCSTPDGRFDSPWYGICARAKPLIADQYVQDKPTEKLVAIADESEFVKFRIAKPDLPAPLWSERRKAKLLSDYHGENTSGYQCNVLGLWGSPSWSVFPMQTIKPSLSRVLDYRVVTIVATDGGRRVRLKAARLSASAAGEPEDLLCDDEFPLVNGRELGEIVARHLPEARDDRPLFCGGDLGEKIDPSEFLVIRKSDRIFQDLFRLHFQGVEYLIQREVLAVLDHHLGAHQTYFALDDGNAGSEVVKSLRKDFDVCPYCRKDSGLYLRVSPVAFGSSRDECDIDTGEPVTNPKSLDGAGRERPIHRQVKEWSTRLIESAIAARRIAIADDGGAGNASLGSVQLLVSHTYAGVNAQGNRRFRPKGDHYVDARRLAMIAAAEAARAGVVGFIGAERDDLVVRLPGAGRYGRDFGGRGRGDGVEIRLQDGAASAHYPGKAESVYDRNAGIGDDISGAGSGSIRKKFGDW